MWKIEGQICPHCGSHLIIREGQYGEFLACPRFPACKFTKPLPDGDLKIYSPPSPYCKKCNHTGLLPFKKDERIISHIFVDCSCKQQPERYQPLHPDDFDYPMSSDFRAHSYKYCNQPDLGYVPLEPEAPLPQVIEHRHSDMSKKDFATLQNLEGQVKYLQSKLTERTKPKHMTKPAAYKGIK